VLTLAHTSTGRYGPEAQAMTSTFASYAAVAVQNSRLFSEAQVSGLDLHRFLQVANASQASSTIEDLLDTMVGSRRCWSGLQNALSSCGMKTTKPLS
jgi:phosphoserine phosphatase RsbU/P